MTAVAPARPVTVDRYGSRFDVTRFLADPDDPWSDRERVATFTAPEMRALVQAGVEALGVGIDRRDDPAPDADAARAAWVDAEVAGVRVELSRVDAKAAMLAGLAGAALAVLATALTSRALPVPAAVTGWTGVGVLAAAVVTLLLATRPRTGRNPVAGWPAWALLTPGQLLRAAAGPDRDARSAELLIVLSRLAAVKFTWVRWSVDLLLAAVTLTGLAGVLAVAS